MEKEFILNSDASLANAIRRTIIGQVPTSVIDTVTIKENDSHLPDEMIAHRMGQIPLRTEEGYGSKISLEAVGPCKVYSRDIVFEEGVEPTSPDILLLSLGKSEHIRLVGEIQEGIGADHAKWSPAIIGYKKLEENKFQLKIESKGSLTANEILNKSLEILKADIVKYKKQL